MRSVQLASTAQLSDLSRKHRELSENAQRLLDNLNVALDAIIGIDNPTPTNMEEIAEKVSDALTAFGNIKTLIKSFGNGWYIGKAQSAIVLNGLGAGGLHPLNCVKSDDIEDLVIGTFKNAEKPTKVQLAEILLAHPSHERKLAHSMLLTQIGVNVKEFDNAPTGNDAEILDAKALLG